MIFLHLCAPHPIYDVVEAVLVLRSIVTIRLGGVSVKPETKNIVGIRFRGLSSSLNFDIY